MSIILLSGRRQEITRMDDDNAPHTTHPNEYPHSTHPHTRHTDHTQKMLAWRRFRASSNRCFLRRVPIFCAGPGRRVYVRVCGVGIRFGCVLEGGRLSSIQAIAGLPPNKGIVLTHTQGFKPRIRIPQNRSFSSVLKILFLFDMTFGQKKEITSQKHLKMENFGKFQF